jgi:AraC-like DNA-binding protein
MVAGNLKEEIYYITRKELPGIALLCANNSGKLWNFFHESYDICCPSMSWRGISENKYRNQNFTFKAGRMSVYEPGEVHKTTLVTAPANFRVLMVSATFMRSYLEMLDVRPAIHFKTFVENATLLRDKMNRLASAIETNSSGLLCESSFYSFIDAFITEFSECFTFTIKSDITPGLKRVREYIEEHFIRDIRLDELAKISCMSKFHFLRSFKKAYSITPHTFLIRVRISKAQQCMNIGKEFDCSMFSDQSHFIRTFKQVFGVTPKKYREMIANPRRFSF